MVVVVIGTSGSGKSTTCNLLAKLLGVRHVDSGLFYRAVVAILLYEKISIDTDNVLQALEELLPMEVEIVEDTEPCVLWKGVSLRLRSAEVTKRVSFVAAMSEVRIWVDAQVGIVLKQGNCLINGRSPDEFRHDHLVWIETPMHIRVRRYCDEQVQKGNTVSFDEARHLLQVRDKADMNREVAPLYRPEGVMSVSTEDCRPEEVAQTIANRIRMKTLFPDR